MKNVKELFLVIILCCFGINACDLTSEEDEAPANVYEKISGTWTINQMNMLGMNIPGDGSTLTFEFCDQPPCTGQDYEASGETTGTFTYEFVENDTKIVIIDEDENGGNYNTTWSVLDFGTQELRMSGDFSIFGSMLLEMSK